MEVTQMRSETSPEIGVMKIGSDLEEGGEQIVFGPELLKTQTGIYFRIRICWKYGSLHLSPSIHSNFHSYFQTSVKN